MTDILIVDVSAANALGGAPGRSSLQDDIDWTWLVAQGVRGAYVEGFVGNDGPNGDFTDQLADASDAGLAVGVYDFCFPLPAALGHPNRDPIAQAALHAAHALPWAKGMMPFMVDLEWPYPADIAKWGCSKAQISAWANAYLLERDRLAGRTVGVYTYPDWFAELLELDASHGTRPFWCAGTSPWLRAPWEDWTLWQKTGHEVMVPTRTGRPPVKTDLSVFNGDEAAWQAFLGC